MYNNSVRARIHKFCITVLKCMSDTHKIVVKVLKEQSELYSNLELNEDIGKFARNALLSGMIAFGGANNAIAQTNYDALHTNHEITARHEHGGKGYYAITKDNYGGYSYGKLQLSTERRGGKPSTFDFFLKFAKKNNPGIYNQLIKAGGQPAAFKGDKKFTTRWKELADRKDFRELYDSFILNDQIIPVYKRMDNATENNFDNVTSWGSTNEAIQAAIKSIIIQHGKNGAYKLIKKTIDNNNSQTKERFLTDLYNTRIKTFPAYKNRYETEYAELKKLLNSKAANIVMASASPDPIGDLIRRLELDN